MGLVENIRKLLENRKGVVETPDPTPVEAPFKFNRPKDLATMVREAVQSQHLAQLAQAEGFDSFEEWDDYDVEDEDSMESEHDLVRDEDLEREVPRYEKRHLDKSRREFDEFYKQKQKEARDAARLKKKKEKVEEELEGGQ